MKKAKTLFSDEKIEQTRVLKNMTLFYYYFLVVCARFCRAPEASAFDFDEFPSEANTKLTPIRAPGSIDFCLFCYLSLKLNL